MQLEKTRDCNVSCDTCSFVMSSIKGPCGVAVEETGLGWAACKNMHVMTTCDGQRERPFRCAAPCERLDMLGKLIMIARW